MNLIPSPLMSIIFNYYDIDQLQTLNKFTNKSSLSLFHLNTCSLSKNIDDFEQLIQSPKTDFDITKNKLASIDVSIANYNYEFCPTEACHVKRGMI